MEKTKILDNPSPAEAITLEKKCANNVLKVMTLKNLIIPVITTEFRVAAEESKCTDAAAVFILQRRIATNEEVQTDILDTVIGQSEVIGKIAHELYKKMVQSPKNYQFKPLNMNKPQKLTLQALKN